jgi:hypothetical protein
MKQQTAVEFLINEISVILGPLKNKPMQDLLMVDAINKAKEMEKNNLEKFYDHGSLSLLETGHGDTFEKYYNKTFKNK